MFHHENKKIFEKLFESAKSAYKVKTSRHSTAIVYKNKILAIGISKNKTHPLQKKYGEERRKCYLHSEIDAIVKVINQYGSEILTECSVYNLRLTSTDTVAMSKPCVNCARALEAFNIKEVFWT